MLKFLIIFFISFGFAQVYTQPYVDPFNIRYTNAFENKHRNATPFTHTYIGSDLPLQLKNKGLIVISPFYENWNIDSANNTNYLPAVSSIALPISVVIPLGKNNWSLMATAIPRFNSEGLQQQNSFQMGGVMLANYKKKTNLTYKFGFYVNNEFFGVFVMPLAGIDWRINERNNLFGLLPGRLTYEYKLNNHFYTGGTFRAITNSYKLSNGNYLRIDDNQLSAYLDYYPAKHVVCTLEPGYGIMRKLRSGYGHNKNTQQNLDWGDGFFIKLSASYRIRL
ncbi:DUF6268 family outer membrane beta-barrel protein [Limnovirga soli]|uniref:DUF6268 domain-containing protein n=1 Tax=Limnovirga soli TaxID=2656915 RepID=A0A8J8FC72_9BACT|nr:DUF6268 family outer membrane beta-barrel protein [Limnovirga soli]NNV55361.1 hypothetical protein [Limnovirga soli]